MNQQQAQTIEKMTAHIARIEDESRRVDEALFKMTRVTDRIDGRAESMDQVPFVSQKCCCFSAAATPVGRCLNGYFDACRQISSFAQRHLAVMVCLCIDPWTYFSLSIPSPPTLGPPVHTHSHTHSQAIRDARSAADAVGARSAAAEQRALDAHDGLQRLTDRVNRTEPRVDDSLKELAYSVEGARAR